MVSPSGIAVVLVPIGVGRFARGNRTVRRRGDPTHLVAARGGDKPPLFQERRQKMFRRRRIVDSRNQKTAPSFLATDGNRGQLLRQKPRYLPALRFFGRKEDTNRRVSPPEVSRKAPIHQNDARARGAGQSMVGPLIPG